MRLRAPCAHTWLLPPLAGTLGTVTGDSGLEVHTSCCRRGGQGVRPPNCPQEGLSLLSPQHQLQEALLAWQGRASDSRPTRGQAALARPSDGRRANQSLLKEINPEYSLEGLMLKVQYSGHLMRRADSLEKSLMLGKTESRRRRGHRG